MGANDQQTLRAFLEAEAYDGPSLIIAYSHCIAHGIEMHMGLEQQRLAVASGHWPLLRYDPRKEQPLQLDSKDPSVPIAEYMAREGRFRALKSAHPEAWEQLLQRAARRGAAPGKVQGAPGLRKNGAGGGEIRHRLSLWRKPRATGREGMGAPGVTW